MAPPGLVIQLKWTKTNQTGHHIYLIPLPSLPASDIDPVRAFQILRRNCPAPVHAPLLCFTQRGTRRVFTTNMLQSLFKAMIGAIGEDPASFSLHGLRRGGATAAFNAGVDATAVQQQGTWSSQVFWQYIAQDVSKSSVAAGFRRLALGSPL